MHTDDEIFVKLTPELFSEVVKWWEAHKFPVLPDRSQDYGYMSFVNGKPIFCTFYFHHDYMAYATLWVVNPEASLEERSEGFKILSDGIADLAKKDGVVYLNTISNNESLITRLVDNKYIACDTGVTHLLRILKEG